MPALTRLFRTGRRLWIAFVLAAIFLLTLACNAGLTNPAEGEGLTPVADISAGLVMNGTATITYYFEKQCTLEGTAVLTVQSDGSFLLAVTSPYVDTLCVQSSDQRISKLYGQVKPAIFKLSFDRCNLDMGVSADSRGWINQDNAGGDAVCYYSNQASKPYLKVAFDVKK